MRGLRTLVLGETRTVPVGVAAVVAGAVLAGELAPAWWADAGGVVVGLAVALVLVAALAGAVRHR